MMKLGGGRRRTVQKSRPSSNLKVIASWVRTPKNVALGYDVGKIGADSLVFNVKCCILVFHIFVYLVSSMIFIYCSVYQFVCLTLSVLHFL